MSCRRADDEGTKTPRSETIRRSSDWRFKTPSRAANRKQMTVHTASLFLTTQYQSEPDPLGKCLNNKRRRRPTVPIEPVRFQVRPSVKNSHIMLMSHRAWKREHLHVMPSYESRHNGGCAATTFHIQILIPVLVAFYKPQGVKQGYQPHLLQARRTDGNG